MHTYIHKYVHTYIHTYTYVHTCTSVLCRYTDHLYYFSECDIGEIDLVFLLDSSFSIRREGLWPALRDFTVQISSMLNIGLEQSLVGLIRFTRRAEIIFNLQEHTSNDTLIPALQSVPQGRGTTRTHTALRLLRQSATDGRMGLREGYTHIAIIVTDGRSIERDATIIQANLLHEENIYEVYAVGIGADIRIEELNAIASSPSQVFFMNEFAATAMQQVGQKITQELCSRQCELIIEFLKTSQY